MNKNMERGLRVLILLAGVMIGVFAASANAEEKKPEIADILAVESHIYEPEEMVIVEREAEPVPIEPEIVEQVDDGIPDALRVECESVGALYGICPELLESVAFYESTYRETVISADGKYYGAFQIHPPSHKARMERLDVTKSDLLTYHGGALVAADYIAELSETCEDIAGVLIFYHGESRAAYERYIQTGQTSAYIQKVLAKSAELEQLHGK